mmetsp:Transcript_1151/g.1894  ORF Transcript_1151/g.1894 Transcript_1151/m.1894 type:complete len:547 (-) Transcript_1151:989-2629(-)
MKFNQKSMAMEVATGSASESPPVAVAATTAAFEALSEGTGDFWVDIRGQVPILHNPSPEEFLREAVCRYHPVIITGMIDHWPALQRWPDPQYLIHRVDRQDGQGEHRGSARRSATVSVNLTPDGHGDCVKNIHVTKTRTKHRTNTAIPTGRGSESGERIEATVRKEVPIADPMVGKGGTEQQHHLAQEEEGEDEEEETTTTTAVVPHFVYPAEVDMTMTEFFRLLNAPTGTVSQQALKTTTLLNSSSSSSSSYSSPAATAGAETVVPYLSQQNDNLRTSMPQLLTDIDATLPLAEVAFGSGSSSSFGANSNSTSTSSSSSSSNSSSVLEALNLWIGDERSVSSLHKDHFENMYAVVSGVKTFTLLPPTDVVFLQQQPQRYQQQQHQQQQQQQQWQQQQQVDNDDSRRTRCRYIDSHTHPVRCEVKAGEVLYIPAMWYHRVSQRCLTVAVNFWYEQRFDFRYVLYQSLVALATTSSDKNDNDGNNCSNDNDNNGMNSAVNVSDLSFNADSLATGTAMQQQTQTQQGKDISNRLEVVTYEYKEMSSLL